MPRDSAVRGAMLSLSLAGTVLPVSVGSGTLHGNQATVRRGLLLLKRVETVRPDALLSGIKKTGKAIEPEFEKSIEVIEYPPRSEQGPLRALGGITLNHLMVMSMKSGTG